MIKEIFFKSLIQLKQNLKILIPDFVYKILVIAISFLAAPYYLTASRIVELDTPKYLNVLSSKEVLTTFSFIGLVALVLFLIGVGVDSMRFGLINDLIKKNRCLLRNCKSYVKKYYFNVFKMKLWIGVIYIIGAILAFIPPVLMNFTLAKNYALYTFVASGTIIFTLVSLALVFRYPILIMENKSALDSIKESYGFLKKNFIYTFKVGLTMLLIALILFSVGALSRYVSGLSYVVIGLDIIALVFFSLFTFNSYHLKRRP